MNIHRFEEIHKVVWKQTPFSYQHIYIYRERERIVIVDVTIMQCSLIQTRSDINMCATVNYNWCHVEWGFSGFFSPLFPYACNDHHNYVNNPLLTSWLERESEDAPLQRFVSMFCLDSVNVLYGQCQCSVLTVYATDDSSWLYEHNYGTERLL